MNDNPDVVLATAHTFKGLEADIVYINDDLNDSLFTAERKKRDFYNKNKQEEKLPLEISNELNLYYVALSRARIKIENISPLLDSEISIDSNANKGIKINKHLKGILDA